MKTIGILGGLGPQATMDFEARLHQAAQGLIPAQGNMGYPPLIVYYHRRTPVVMHDEHTPLFPLQPDPALLEMAQWLGTKADFLIITANSPHIIQAQIEQAAGRPVLSMIHVTLDEVRRRGWRKIGVLGFGDLGVAIYTQPLDQLGLSYEIVDPDLQGRLNEAGLALQAGCDNAESAAVMRAAVDILRARKVDGIILGCTEFPLLLHESASAPDLINPAQLLAEAAVRYALT